MEYWNGGMLSKTTKTFIFFSISTHTIGKNYVLKFNRGRRWSKFFKASKGSEILESLRQLQHFHSDCALLLKTGESAMIEAGWKSCFRNTAIADLSKSIEFPDYWSPYFAFRFFQNDRYKPLAAFLSIIFDLPDDPKLIEEPLVSAGLLDYGKNAAGSRADLGVC